MKNLFVFLFIGMIALTSCKKDDEGEIMTKINFKLMHKVDGQDLELDKIKYQNAAGNSYSVINLKYFVSSFVLHKSTGEKIVLSDVHYVDISDSSTLSFSPETVIPNGDYNQISFVFGLNETENTDGRFPNPPLNAMEWPVPLGGGYHYMKLEGKYDNAGQITNYNTHTGATNGTPYHVEVSLPVSFTLSGTESTAEIIMDINKWYQDPNVYDFSVYGMMIMGNGDAQKVIQENGANVFSIGDIN